VSFELIDLDHLIIRVADLESSVDTYRSFGFTVTPPRLNVGMAALKQQAAGGDAAPAKAPFNNRLILFQPYPGRDDLANFLELMCMEDQFGPPEITQLMSFMLDTEGPKAISCASADFERTVRAMDDAGIASFVPDMFETGWQDEERDRFVAIRARPVVPVYRQTPFMVNSYETSTLDNYRYEPWTVHPNTARYMAGVTGVTDDLRAHAEWMAKDVFGVAVEWESDEVAIVRPRDLFLRIVSPAGFAELYPGLDFSSERILPALCGATVAVESLERLRELLRENGVEHVETPRGGVVVPRRHANNTVLEFVAMDAAR